MVYYGIFTATMMVVFMMHSTESMRITFLFLGILVGELGQYNHLTRLRPELEQSQGLPDCVQTGFLSFPI